MKTVIEEQETQITAKAIPHEQISREQAVRSVRHQQAPSPAPNGAQAKVDCYESCLDLSALFLPRG